MVPFYFIQKNRKIQKVIYMGDNLLYDGHNTGTEEKKGAERMAHDAGGEIRCCILWKAVPCASYSGKGWENKRFMG